MKKVWLLLVIGIILPRTSHAMEPSSPPSYDMRRWLYPVKDQLFRGSCTVFAALGAMEAYGGVPSLSEAYAYSLLKAEHANPEGASPQQLKQLLESTPMLAASKMNYANIVGVTRFGNDSNELQVARWFNAQRGHEAAFLAPQAIYQARGVRLHDAPTASNAPWLKRMISSNVPVVAFFLVNELHWQQAGEQGGRIHEPWVDPATGHTVVPPNQGGHAVLLVGYTSDGRFIVRNSWGVKWGDQGYGYMSEDYLKRHIQAALTIDYVEVPQQVISTWQAERFDVRVHGWQETPGGSTYTASISLVRQEPFVTQAPLTGVIYEVYDLNTQRLLATLPSNHYSFGYYAEARNLPTHSLKIRVILQHGWAGGPPQQPTIGWRTIPNIVTFSPTRFLGPLPALGLAPGSSATRAAPPPPGHSTPTPSPGLWVPPLPESLVHTIQRNAAAAPQPAAAPSPR